MNRTTEKTWVWVTVWLLVSIGVYRCAGDNKETSEPVAPETGEAVTEAGEEGNGDSAATAQEEVADNNLATESDADDPTATASGDSKPTENYELDDAQAISDPATDGTLAETSAVQEQMIDEAVTPAEPETTEPVSYDMAESAGTPAAAEAAAPAPVAPVTPVTPVTAEPVVPAVAADEAVKSPTTTAGSSTSSGSVDTGVYVVQPGETLGQISEKVFGTSRRWRELASINNLSNPNSLHPGDTINYPKSSETAAFTTSYSAAAKDDVVVVKGDTLSSIAKAKLGSSSYWRYIWRFNETVIPNPNLIRAGQEISYVVPDQKFTEAAVAAKPKEVEGELNFTDPVEDQATQ